MTYLPLSIGAIVATLLWLTGLIVTILLVPLLGLAPAQEEDIVVRGQAHYQRYCGVCHGAQGKGNGPLVAYLKVTPVDLTQLCKRNGGEFPFWRVYRIMDGREDVPGHGTREMPIWGREIPIDDWTVPQRVHEDLIAGRIWQMMVYLQSIQEK